MDDRSATGVEPGPRRQNVTLGPVLAETVVVQALGTVSVLILSALAPAVAQALNVPTVFIGYQITVIYIGGIVSSLYAGGLVARYGGCRTGQVAMLLAAIGCLLMSVPNLPAIIAGSSIIGLSYGLINPASSDLLARYTPAHRRNLIFSIKQAGVPLGGIMAGLLGPWLALSFGWHAALWCVSAVCFVAMAAAQITRAEMDGQRTKQHGSGPSAAALMLLLRTPAQRWLAFASFCFSAVQLSIVAFLVALLVEEKSFDLASAGLVLAAVQLSGAFGRIFWGAIADALRNGLNVLILLAVTMTLLAAAVAMVTSMPISVLVVLLVLLGLSANSWNGVYLSEVARLSPASSIGATTGASMIFTFTGVAVGPSLFSRLHGLFGTYQRSYILITLFAMAAAGFVLLVKHEASRGVSSSEGQS